MIRAAARMTAGAARAAPARGQEAARAQQWKQGRAIAACWRAPPQRPWRASATHAVTARLVLGWSHAPAHARLVHGGGGGGGGGGGDEAAARVMERLGLPFVPSRWHDIISNIGTTRFHFAEDGRGELSLILTSRLMTDPSGVCAHGAAAGAHLFCAGRCRANVIFLRS